VARDYQDNSASVEQVYVNTWGKQAIHVTLCLKVWGSYHTDCGDRSSLLGDSF
jgi:hypothetical protein